MGRKKPDKPLSRRERQIMDIVYKLEEASVSDVLERLPDPPSYSAVRATMRLLHDKKHLRYRRDGLRYVYLPRESRSTARRSALRHVMDTFFEDSPVDAVAALLDLSGGEMSDDDYDRLTKLVEQARTEGR